ncbi:MAG TPA: ABC transporter permease [Pyrinomonadaceae bacterium]|nr:ABC transporter permease [Pyrinomonadaceae bacterium]
MRTLLQDVRYGARTLRKSPGFTAVAVLALALGVGANTAIFSVVKAVLLSPLPYPESGRLLWLREVNPSNGILDEPASAPNFNDWRAQARSLEAVAAYANTSTTLTGEGEPERVPGVAASANFFPALGVAPALGRGFLPEEEAEGKNRVVVISHGLWQRRFGARPDAVGQTLTLSGNPHTVIGVAPADFKSPVGGPKPAEFWTPIAFNFDESRRRSDYLSVFARLKAGATVGQARAELEGIASRLAQQYPGTNTGWNVAVGTLHERVVGDVRPALLVLTGVVGFLLLISCANVANLMLARSSARRQEVAVRSALGARRGRLVRQFLTESVLLSLAGGAAGLVLAWWGVELLVGLGPGNIPRLEEVGLDARVLLFTLAVSVATGVAFGLLPALSASKTNLSESLKEGGSRGSTAGAGARRLRNSLVVSEIAIAVVLLAGAGLMIRSFQRIQEVDPGFSPARVLTFDFALPAARYKEDAQVTAFVAQLTERVGAVPGAERAAVVDTLPLSGGGNVAAFVVEGRPAPPPEQVQDAEYRVVSPEYFDVMGVRLVRGQLFTARDREGSPAVAVVNEAMARRYWPGEDPIGKRVNLGNPETSPWRMIVGVVRDVRHDGLDKEPYPQMYSPAAQFPRRGMTLVARASADPASLVPAIRRELSSLDKDLPLYNVRTMEQVLSDSVSRRRFQMLLIAAFAFVGLLLAAVGTYGVISYSVAQRRHEIGVRMALGARAPDILRLVLGQGLGLALAGVGIGLAAAFALTRVMSSLLYGVSATDPLTFAAVSLALLCVAAAACLVPARRATRVDPMEALRYE